MENVNNIEYINLIDMNNVPTHIAIIMDGNGRWAKEKKLPRSLGHRAGVKTVKRIVKACDKINVKYLTLYAFSTENWKRPKDEVSTLMSLLVEYLKKEINELNENNVIIDTIGDISKLPLICQKELHRAYEITKNNTGLVLNLALNYGGRNEIINAVKNICSDIQHNNMSYSEINEDLFKKYLYTANIPDPDLIIRTSGEKRLSNFLLWQCAYSEFWDSNIKWPDFTKEHLYKSIYDYQNRHRRYGGI